MHCARPIHSRATPLHTHQLLTALEIKFIRVIREGAGKRTRIIKSMEPRPLPLDEELKHLFTKTLVQDDMVGLALVGDSYDYLASLPRPIYNEMVTKGLQIRLYPPNQRLVTICHESRGKSFKLLRNDWAAIVKESGFEVGDKIACWACCHDLGGNFSLLIEKVPSDIECGR